MMHIVLTQEQADDIDRDCGVAHAFPPPEESAVARIEAWRQQRMALCQSNVERSWVNVTVGEIIEVIGRG